MTSGLYRCNACGFSVPADEIGAAIMKQHLDTDCPGSPAEVPDDGDT